MGMCGPETCSRGLSRNTWPEMVMLVAGGITSDAVGFYVVAIAHLRKTGVQDSLGLGSRLASDLVVGLGVVIRRRRHVVCGRSFRSWVKASRPPADAPMPTTGTIGISVRGSCSSSFCGCVPAAKRRLFISTVPTGSRTAARGIVEQCTSWAGVLSRTRSVRFEGKAAKPSSPNCGLRGAFIGETIRFNGIH